MLTAVTIGIVSLALASGAGLSFYVTRKLIKSGADKEKLETIEKVLNDVEKAYRSRNTSVDLARVRKKYQRD